MLLFTTKNVNNFKFKLEREGKRKMGLFLDRNLLGFETVFPRGAAVIYVSYDENTIQIGQSFQDKIIFYKFWPRPLQSEEGDSLTSPSYKGLM